MNQMIKDWFHKKRGGNRATFLKKGEFGPPSG